MHFRARLLLISWLACSVGALLWPAAAHAESLHDRFDEAQPALARQLKSRRVEERLSALDALRRLPVADSAKLVHGCFIDVDDSVRNAAYDALQAMNNEQEVCDTLIGLAESNLKSKRSSEMVLPALAALLSSELPLAQTRAQCFLDERLIETPRGIEILVSLADNLGAHGKAADVKPLVRISKTRMFSKHFGIRRAVVQALTRTPSAESIGPLIGMMDVVGGEAKADAASYLAQVTGQRHGLDTNAWQKWHAAQTVAAMPQASSKPLTVSVSKVTEGTFKRVEEVPSEGGHYYGIPIFAERLVFVLDVSGSMQGRRFQAAKRELVQAIDNLQAKAKFGIVVFNSTVGRWHDDLVPATAANKQEAIRFIENQNPQASTSTFNALEAALAYDIEAIYFLTDGAPTSGKILAPADIIHTVIDGNRLRRISIYTIGIAPGFSGSPTDQFLKSLAEENLGTYRRVDG
jgi:hypothetical protein